MLPATTESKCKNSYYGYYTIERPKMKEKINVIIIEGGFDPVVKEVAMDA